MNRKYDGGTEEVFKFFDTNYRQHGYSKESLGWCKGKQNIRFERLTRFFGLENEGPEKRIFDIGCGFGDLNKYFEKTGYKNYQYTGCDLVNGFIETADQIFSDHKNITFVCDDFLEMDVKEEYDYIIASGIFNLKMHEKDNYQNIYDVMEKAMKICNQTGAIAFDFQSDKVDFVANDIGFYNSPGKVLDIAYNFSRNIVLDNSYMPFEFAVIIFKDDSFCGDTTTFNKFRMENKRKYENGIF